MRSDLCKDLHKSKLWQSIQLMEERVKVDRKRREN